MLKHCTVQYCTVDNGYSCKVQYKYSICFWQPGLRCSVSASLEEDPCSRVHKSSVGGKYTGVYFPFHSNQPEEFWEWFCISETGSYQNTCHTQSLWQLYTSVLSSFWQPSAPAAVFWFIAMNPWTRGYFNKSHYLSRSQIFHLCAKFLYCFAQKWKHFLSDIWTFNLGFNIFMLR